MKSRIYWTTFAELGALTLVSMLIVLGASIGAVAPFGLYLYVAAIASYASFRIFRAGPKPVREYLTIVIPVIAIIGGGWFWSEQAISIFKAREGPVYLGDVELASHYEHWACEMPLAMTTLILTLYLMVMIAMFVARKRRDLAIASTLIATPAGFLNVFYYASTAFHYFD